MITPSWSSGSDWGQEEKGMTENEIVGWHHGLDGHEFGCSDASATPGFPSQPEGKIGLPRANPRGMLRSPS